MLLDQLEERCHLAAQTRQRYYRSSSCTRGAPPSQQIQPYHYPPSWRDPWLVGSFGPRLEARFEVGEELGRGHFGVVRVCQERGSGATFACKTISKELLQGSREMEELRAEALTPLLLQQMAEEEEEERAREGDEEEAVNPVNPVNSTSTERSPWEGLVRLHSVYEDNWGVHLVMDHCSGGDLFDLVDRYAESAGMPEQLAAAVVGKLAATLAWMHSVGVVHRDLKPENILLARPFSGDASSFPNLHLCIADFGLARRLAPGEHLTGLVGSPFYLAPEVVKGHLYDHQVDVWSLGIILYTCLSGKLPFHGPNHNAVFAAACRAAPDLVSPELWSGVSAEAKDLVRGMLEKEPGRRIRSGEILSHPWFDTFQPASSQLSQPTASHQSSQSSQPSQPSQQDQYPCAEDTATPHLTTTPTPEATANASADPNHLTTPPQDDATSSHSPTPPRPTPPRPLSICPPPPPFPSHPCHLYYPYSPHALSRSLRPSTQTNEPITTPCRSFPSSTPPLAADSAPG
ncbi:unnamed protein product [Closterium sp. NIES-65]|nr:unnamed protein product [Closterium sp. NIES-65]